MPRIVSTTTTISYCHHENSMRLRDGCPSRLLAHFFREVTTVPIIVTQKNRRLADKRSWNTVGQCVKLHSDTDRDLRQDRMGCVITWQNG